jgi:hypothetical protein
VRKQESEGGDMSLFSLDGRAAVEEMKARLS